MKEFITGMVIGNEENSAIVKSSKGIVYIPETHLGGELKPNKAKVFLGATITFFIVEDEEGQPYGDRKSALEQMKGENTFKVGETHKARILIVFPKSMVVECLGQELYIPVERCLPYWNDNMQSTGEFEVGDTVIVNVESVEPVMLKINFEQDLSQIKNKGNYLGEVKSIISKGSFVQLLISDTIVHCRPVDWRKALMVGDLVTVEVNDIRVKENRVFGLIRRRNKGCE